jgi:hypothetical protein
MLPANLLTVKLAPDNKVTVTLYGIHNIVLQP